MVQEMCLPRCTVRITLTEDSNTAADQDIEQAVRDIAETQKSLNTRGVTVLVQLHCPSMERLPEPHSLQRLAPILQSIQWPSLSALYQDCDELWRKGFSAVHASALQIAASPLQRLGILDYGIQQRSMQLNSSSIHAVESLLNLTGLNILHHNNLDFAPLQHSSHLQELALKSWRIDHEECCFGVLESSRDRLRTVQLQALSWSDRTYQALEGLPHLRLLDMTICALSTDQAYILADLVQPQNVRNALQDCCENNVQPSTIQALTAGRARITELVMRRAPHRLLRHVSTMDYLTELCIMDPFFFSGLHMQPQPHVKKLTWRKVTNLSTEGLQHTISMLPALKYLYFQEGPCGDRWPWRLSKRLSLAVLAQARQLEEILCLGCLICLSNKFRSLSLH